jgi:hypothetical protein
MLSQWIAFGVFLLLMLGLAYAFARKGMTIKPDPESKPPTDLGGGTGIQN